MDHTIWDYLRIRLHYDYALPSRNFQLEDCAPGASIGNFVVGAELGKGAVDMVCRPSPHGEIKYPSHTKQVLKMIQKEDGASDGLDIMKAIVKEIAVMQKLSTPMHQHPNSIKLFKGYHSPSRESQGQARSAGSR